MQEEQPHLFEICICTMFSDGWYHLFIGAPQQICLSAWMVPLHEKRPSSFLDKLCSLQEEEMSKQRRIMFKAKYYPPEQADLEGMFLKLS